MADPTGFLTHARAEAPKRDVRKRVADWREVYAELDPHERNEAVRTQASRCMDCGIPFCHSAGAGCPLGNLIPEWNELVRRGEWERASERLHATNNFPEFTGMLCPAPCEAGCVLAITPALGGPVTIKRIEQAIVDTAWERGYIRPLPPEAHTGRRVAVVGSGPAGLAAAQQLRRAGHAVTVFERDDRSGGLLRYGIPEFKMEKQRIDRRLWQLESEGVEFVTGCEVGVDLHVPDLRSRFGATVLAVGALRGRDDRGIPGRELDGIHLAMEHLVPANRECAGDGPSPITARGKHVVIVGGGDTGADCYGTATRQGALSVTQLDQYPRPPEERDDTHSPWPTWPHILRTYPAYEEGGSRVFGVGITRFLGDDAGHVREIELSEVAVRRDPESGRREVTPVGEPARLPADLVLLAIGFTGVEPMRLLDDLGLRPTARGTLGCSSDWQTAADGVFTCGDAHRGASLIVWAIAEGRAAAHAVDAYLTGESRLPDPVHPAAMPLSVV
ncbi:glutamate synthase subunit beta [Haloechinothrix sp. LS1_15]|uniref:glutamate synthase subunit beta n=1 Tax=Haloechinothrix sp. LS1_15 TaxID=2652248 RepID=UPI0029485ADD|nr:glutamate synthase subunit beta [Haloechinothrix sp. LS1_15]MDV6012666.1 glutamate synthase subunit beta [Haloechinothrix sp. LS1_15]